MVLTSFDNIASDNFPVFCVNSMHTWFNNKTKQEKKLADVKKSNDYATFFLRNTYNFKWLIYDLEKIVVVMGFVFC